MSRRLACLRPFALLLACAVAPGAVAQDSVAVDASGPASQALVTREEAQRRIAELEASTDGEDGKRAHLLDLYRQLVQRIDAERSNETRAEAFRQAIESAPAEAAQVRMELAANRAAPSPVPERPANATVDELNLQLTQLQADLASLRTQQAELERRIAEEEALPVRTQAAEARDVLAQIGTELAASPEPGPDASEEERVARALLYARQRARAAEVAMLEQQLLSSAARTGLLQARRDLVAWRAAQAEAAEAALEGWLSELRQGEAERARREAERLRTDALDKHPLIREVAAEIAELTRETERIVPSIDTMRERRRQVETRLAQTRADYDQTTRALELGITRALGTVLLEQRRNLPDADSYVDAAAARSEEVARARMQLFDIERQLKQLADPEREAERLVAADSGAELAAVGRAELASLLGTKRETLRHLQSALHDYLTAVRNLDVQEQALIELAEDFGGILDERLIWFPDAQPLDLPTLARLGSDFRWLVSRDPWSETSAVAGADVRRRPVLYALVVLVAAGLLVARPRFRRKLATLAEKAGKVRKDGIMLTVEALLLQLANTLPLPAVVALLGWRLGAAPETNDASRAVGTGLAAAAGVTFAFQFLRNLYRANGIARAHFSWSERTGQLVRRHLLWYVAIAAPATFLIAVTQTQLDPLIRYGLGRVAFVVLMVATAVLAWFLLRKNGGLFVGHAAAVSSAWLRRTRPAWVVAGLILPLGLAVMAALGYYYAALQLEYRLNQTLAIILSAVFIHAFCLRWLVISQRRLALKVALERRAALARVNEAGDVEEAASAESVVEALGEIDVTEIKEQTQDLLRVSVGIYLVVTIWFAWISVLPALGVLDNVTLWHHDVMVDGETRQHPITLANLGLALVAILMTMTAARNMPGFLEIAVLQRLPVEPGVRYATRTLLLYAIVATGIVLAFNAVGIGWSSVQWLVAALTVGLGFGLQEIFANFVSGLVLLLERPIRVGDTVTVGDISGVVSRIRMRATTITDWNRRELLVPNRSFITGELINWSLSDPILRMDFTVGIAYGSDTILAHKTMLRVAREHPMVLDQPEPTVFFLGFGDNSLNFDVRVFVNEPTNVGRSRILHDLHMAIDGACRENDITIAFPQRDLHFKTSEAVLRVAIEEVGRPRGSAAIGGEKPDRPD